MSMETQEENKHPEGVDVADGPKVEAGAAGAEAGEPTDAPAAGDDIAGQLEAAQKEIDELKDHWNRERADFANFRKRTVQERARAQGEAVARFTKELLDVVDNLDRVLSIETDNPEVKNFITGVEMIRQGFMTVFQNHRIRVLNPLNEAFDPMRMEAIAREERPDLSTDTVIEVYQAGYSIEFDQGDAQTLRPARVKVGVAPRENAATAPQTENQTETNENAEAEHQS